MRLRVVYEPSANAYYRAIGPMTAMERRGHHIIWPNEDGKIDPQLLIGCNVVHVYRWCGEATRRIFAELARRGVSITYDNDDDVTTYP